MIPDVNVVLAAYRNDHVHHDTARAWRIEARKQCVQGVHSLVLLPLVVTSFIRLVTNPRVFPEPDSVEDAVAFIDVLLQSPGVELKPAMDEWPIMRAKLLTLQLYGNLVTDAWIAATAQALSEHLVTFDRDFSRLLPARDLTLLAV